jgi:hypothetical protein
MNTSTTITKISAALCKAQSEMGNAVKGATNPFFKSHYADLNSIREASLPVLNKHGITVIQPTTVIEGVNYVETVLLHESGEFISSLTQIISAKPNDPQAHGSGLSYARRYALQSICNIGAEDDDAEKAKPQTVHYTSPVSAPPPPETKPGKVAITEKQFTSLYERVKAGDKVALAKAMDAFSFTDAQKETISELFKK